MKQEKTFKYRTDLVGCRVIEVGHDWLQLDTGKKIYVDKTELEEVEDED